MEKKVNFRQFEVRVWRDGDISLRSHDMGCYVSDTHIGVQTNTLDEEMNAKVEEICVKIREDFRELNELLRKIK